MKQTYKIAIFALAGVFATSLLPAQRMSPAKIFEKQQEINKKLKTLQGLKAKSEEEDEEETSIEMNNLRAEISNEINMLAKINPGAAQELKMSLASITESCNVYFDNLIVALGNPNNSKTMPSTDSCEKAYNSAMSNINSMLSWMYPSVEGDKYRVSPTYKDVSTGLELGTEGWIPFDKTALEGNGSALFWINSFFQNEFTKVADPLVGAYSEKNTAIKQIRKIGSGVFDIMVAMYDEDDATKMDGDTLKIRKGITNAKEKLKELATIAETIGDKTSILQKIAADVAKKEDNSATLALLNPEPKDLEAFNKDFNDMIKNLRKNILTAVQVATTKDVDEFESILLGKSTATKINKYKTAIDVTTTIKDLQSALIDTCDAIAIFFSKLSTTTRAAK